MVDCDNWSSSSSHSPRLARLAKSVGEGGKREIQYISYFIKFEIIIDFWHQDQDDLTNLKGNFTQQMVRLQTCPNSFYHFYDLSYLSDLSLPMAIQHFQE